MTYFDAADPAAIARDYPAMDALRGLSRDALRARQEIGRASCRERVFRTV